MIYAMKNQIKFIPLFLSWWSFQSYILSSAAQDPRPNIVVFIADDLGIGDVGCFGNDTIRTPNIDSIAAKGVKLTQHLSASSVCTPSRAALLTGRYPERMGVSEHPYIRVPFLLASSAGLPASEMTFARLLKDVGYATAFVGKWHLGLSCSTRDDFCHHPLRFGFDHFYGVPLTNLRDFRDGDGIVPFTVNPNLLRNSLIYYALFFTGLAILTKLNVIKLQTLVLLMFLYALVAALVFLVITHLKYLNSYLMRDIMFVEHPIRLDNMTARLVRESITLIDRHPQNKPLLLVVSWLHTHTALFSQKHMRGRSKHGFYGDNVEEMDWGVGEILNYMEAADMLNNTFVYFTSDNGGHIGEIGVNGEREGGYNGIYKGGKGQGGQEGAIRMPTAVMWPGHIQPGRVITVSTSLMDLLPTLVELSGAQIPGDRTIDGRSILPHLLGDLKAKPPHRYLAHYCGKDIHSARYTDIEGATWKVHYAWPNWLPGSMECGTLCTCNTVTWLERPILFKLDTDPSEDTPIAPGSKRYVAILKKIKAAQGEFLSSLTEQPENQYSYWNLMFKPWLQPCCGSFPACECVDERNSPEI